MPLSPDSTNDMQAMERAWSASPWSEPPPPASPASIAAVNASTVDKSPSPFTVTGGNTLSGAETLRRLGAALGGVVMAQGQTVKQTSPDVYSTPAPKAPESPWMKWLAIATVAAVILYLARD